MENITLKVGSLGNMKMDIGNIYTDGDFEIGITIKFLDDDKQRIIYKALEKLRIENGWKLINYAESATSIVVSFNNNGFDGKPEITYRLFIYGVPKNPDDMKPCDEPSEIRELNLYEDEKKIFKKIFLETITEQIMEG